MILTKEEAISFLSEFFRGEHHIPKGLKEFGHGWALNSTYTFSTFDSDGLTRLVVLAHQYAIRVEISPASPQSLKIIIHKRQRTGSMFQRHPTLQEVIERKP